jgi:hypothetical protein
MNTDKALAHSMAHWTVGSGDTGRGRVERTSFFKVRFTHQKCKK